MKKLQALLLAFMLFFAGLACAGNVNINTADSDTLTSELNGIGETKARAIITYREKNGPFKSVDELSMVKGIGEGTLEKNRANMTVK